MKRSCMYPNQSRKQRSSSVKSIKSSNKNNHNLFDEFRNDYDVFLDVELNKTNFSLRSFAMGGMPYFETPRISYDADSSNLKNGQNLPQVIQDIIAGKTSPMIKDLFKGISIQGKGIPSFITDFRKSITVKYMLTLYDPEMIDSKNNLSSFQSSDISSDPIYYSSSSLSDNEYSNDSENNYEIQKCDDCANFRVIHTRKLSDVANMANGLF